jgi:hypothetical protein
MIGFIKKFFEKTLIVQAVIETPIHRTCPFGNRMSMGFYSIPAETGGSHCQCSCSQYVKHNDIKVTCIDNGVATIPTKNFAEEMMRWISTK